MKTEDTTASTPTPEAVMDLLLSLVTATETRRALEVLEVCHTSSEALELFELLARSETKIPARQEPAKPKVDSVQPVPLTDAEMEVMRAWLLTPHTIFRGEPSFEVLRKALRVALATSEKGSDTAAPAPRKTPMELLSECATATEAARFVELMRLFEPGGLMAKCRTASEAQSLAKALMGAQDFARFSSGARSFRAAAAPSQAGPSSDSTSPGRTPG